MGLRNHAANEANRRQSMNGKINRIWNKTFPVAAYVLRGIRGRFQKLTVYCFQLSLDMHAHMHTHVYISMNIHSYVYISTDTPTHVCFYECTF